VQAFVVSQRPDDVPTQAIDIDPATLHPLLFRLAQKLIQIIIVKRMVFHPVVGEVNHGYFASLMQTIVSLSLSLGIDTWFCTRFFPLEARRRVVMSHGVGAGWSAF
jgi:hypothetical protein